VLLRRALEEKIAHSPTHTLSHRWAALEWELQAGAACWVGDAQHIPGLQAELCLLRYLGQWKCTVVLQTAEMGLNLEAAWHSPAFKAHRSELFHSKSSVGSMKSNLNVASFTIQWSACSRYASGKSKARLEIVTRHRISSM
jgi:hypothetical protein